jgi:hypothetical protein
MGNGVVLEEGACRENRAKLKWVSLVFLQDQVRRSEQHSGPSKRLPQKYLSQIAKTSTSMIRC